MTGAQGIILVLIVGLAAGVMSGMFGIGGGLVIVPALVILFGLDQKTATGTSLFALLLPVGLLAVIDYGRRGQMRWDLGLLIAPGLFFGALVGARLTRGFSDLQLKRVYAVFLIVVAAYYLFISTERGRALIFARGGSAAKPAGGPIAPNPGQAGLDQKPG